MSRRRFLVAAALVSVAATGCGPRTTSPPTTMVPLIALDQLPTTTAAPTTTIAGTEPAAALLDVVPDLECAYAPVIAGGEVTFVIGDRLYGVAPDGSGIHCFTQLVDTARGIVKWSPTGERALLGFATVFDGDGARQSGYKSDSTRVRWLAPTGAALIAPTTTNNTLVKRDAVTGERTEVTFLWQTELAISHPSGGKLIASGLSPDADRGIFVAGADGSDWEPAAFLADDDTTIVDLATDAGGTDLFVATSNPTRFEIRRLTFPGLTLSDVDAEQEPIGDLTTGPVTKSLAWKVGLCNSITHTRVLDERSGRPVTVGEGSPIDSLSVGPVGWLDASRLVVVARPLGCTGPGDLWIWNALDGTVTLLTRAVELPAVRVAAQRSAALTISPDVAIPEL